MDTFFGTNLYHSQIGRALAIIFLLVSPFSLGLVIRRHRANRGNTKNIRQLRQTIWGVIVHLGALAMATFGKPGTQAAPIGFTICIVTSALILVYGLFPPELLEDAP